MEAFVIDAFIVYPEQYSDRISCHHLFISDSNDLSIYNVCVCVHLTRKSDIIIIRRTIKHKIVHVLLSSFDFPLSS